ncbi:MAG: hypothetical protein ACP5LG_04270 [Conexivisphaera sp.]
MGTSGYMMRGSAAIPLIAIHGIVPTGSLSSEGKRGFLKGLIRRTSASSGDAGARGLGVARRSTS